MTSPLLEIQNLSIRLKVPSGVLHAVRNASLTLNRGEALGIVGESGSGKSLTAMALMRLLPKVANVEFDTLKFDGTDLGEVPEATFTRDYLGPRLSMIFQEPMTSLNPVYTIGRQLTEASVRIGRMTNAQANTRALELLDRVGIPNPKARMAQYPHQLSGGQRQRVMIAMALMLEPELLIADEPTTALDATIQTQIMTLLNDLRREMNMGMILITHDLAVVSENVDRVAVMYGGEIVESGRSGDVLAAPAHPYTRALLTAIPHMGGEPKRLGAIPGTVPALLQPPKGCVFAARCAHAEPRCATERPPRQGSDNHHRLCILTEKTLAELPPAVPSDPLPKREMAHEAVLEARHVSRVFHSRSGLFGPRHEIRAVDDISLSLKRGETLALVGESGSGKTTLSRLLLGLDTPTSGEILLDGQPVEAMDGLRRADLVQPIFQDPYSSLNPRRTLAEIIARPLALRGMGTARERQLKARELMERVRLPERLMHSYPSQLSGGQRQRVAIARALVTSPEILVCDEPTSALDVSVQAQILNLLVDLQAELGLTCLLITHDMAVVHQIASRVAVMLDGKIVEEGPAAELLANPKNAYTRTLLDAAPQFRPTETPTMEATS
ncbi:MAG: ABC transporter ATP-binding protein [Saccharospirillum sp.]|uniref:ABC transporter ATP-binding protein n=1 Tax=Saccharospirillum sp. TaxID=2033801 RepID=UPI0032982699